MNDEEGVKIVGSFVIATNNNIHDLIRREIRKSGDEADLNHIDVSQVTDMTDLFGYRKFNGDISNWDVSNVKCMFRMFECSEFNGDLSKWNVANVIDMNGMFSGSIFNQDISKWNVSCVNDMSWMFDGSKFNQDISDWNVSSVEDIHGMFASSSFNGDISKWVFQKNLCIDNNLRFVIENSHHNNTLAENKSLRNRIVGKSVKQKISL